MGIVLIVGIGGCTLLHPLGEFNAGPSAPSDGGSDVATADADAADAADAPVSCRRERPMVTISAARGRFRIDATEVTQGDYACFLREGAAGTKLPTVCQWKTAFVPLAIDNCKANEFTPDTFPHRAARCIDWCDAWAYCAWEGKRLCGKVGGGTPTTADLDTTTDEWFVACSRDGARKYPYGDTGDVTACWIDTQSAGRPTTPTDVGTNPACVGGYDGLFDMSGNVSEWTAICEAEAGRSDACYARGGSFETRSLSAGCVMIRQEARVFRDGVRGTGGTAEIAPSVGVRCCADPL